MNITSEAVSLMTDVQKTAYIQQVIRREGDRIRQQYPLLAYQNPIGASVMALSVAGMLICAVLYYFAIIPWWFCIPLVTLFESFIHELEHDLIHQLYFKDNPWVYHFMMLVCWITRPSTANPWLRREVHLHHHLHSGTTNDLEQYVVTSGAPQSIKRLIMTGDNLLAILLRPMQTLTVVQGYVTEQKPKSEAEHKRMARRTLSGYFPVGWVHYFLWYSFLGYHVVNAIALLIGYPVTFPPAIVDFSQLLNFLAIVWLIPSYWRTFCLHFVSSNIHYFGDVEDQNLMQQCQVINAWWMLPFQLFCFNLGGTHAIHHFVIRDPFYIRQLTQKKAHEAMRLMGVRFNDFGTFRRTNRFTLETP